MGNELAVDELEEGMIITRLGGVLGTSRKGPYSPTLNVG